MNLPRHIPALDAMVTLRLLDGELTISSTGFTQGPRPHWVNLGPAVLMLTDEEAIDLGDALIRAVHRRRSGLAQYRPAGDNAEAVRP